MNWNKLNSDEIHVQIYETGFALCQFYIWTWIWKRSNFSKNRVQFTNEFPSRLTASWRNLYWLRLNTAEWSNTYSRLLYKTMFSIFSNTEVKHFHVLRCNKCYWLGFFFVTNLLLAYWLEQNDTGKSLCSFKDKEDPIEVTHLYTDTSQLHKIAWCVLLLWYVFEQFSNRNSCRIIME